MHDALSGPAHWILALTLLTVVGLSGCAASAVPTANSPAPHSPAPTTVAPTTVASTTPVAEATALTVTEERYGSDPRQMVTVSRPVGGSGKAVIFLHGGGWRSGDRGSLNREATAWARAGWVAINAGYRLGVLDGKPGDGRLILADVQTVLAKYRVQPYVDPAKIVLYGESAGGHLATWLGAYRGPQVAATVAISPVTSISGAITAAEAPGAQAKIRGTGAAAREFFGDAARTAIPQPYLRQAKNMFIAFSTDEWIDPDLHGRVLCSDLGPRCHRAEYAGPRHAGELVVAHPRLADDARRWADAQLAEQR